MRSPALLATLLLVWGLVACDDGAEDAPPADPCAADAGAAWVELGTGRDPQRVEPLVDDQELEVEPGIQGGFHVWGGFTCGGLHPEDLQLRFSLLDEGRPVGGSEYPDDVRRGPSGHLEYGGVTVFIFNDVRPETLEGRRLELRLELVDRCGRTAGDSRFVRVRYPP